MYRYITKVVCHFSIAHPVEPVYIANFSVAAIIGEDLGPFYRYTGSLTTPTCDESVLWNLYQTPLNMSPTQV